MLKKMRWRFSLTAAVWITFWLYFDHNGDAVYSICGAAFHECGHLLLLFALHDAPQRITFGIFGIALDRARPMRLGYIQELAVYAAGPAANLLLALALLPLPRLRRAVRVNLLLAGFNLLPIPPLDGSGILYAALCLRTSPVRAAALRKKIAACGVLPLAVIVVWDFWHGRRNYSLLLSVVYVLSLFLPSTSM